MTVRTALTAIVILMAGCTSDWDRNRTSTTGKGSRSALPESVEAIRAGRRMAVRRPKAFASLPDRGELLAYDRKPHPVRRDAHTLYPIRLSEAHALRTAHRDGVMVIRSPEGKPIRLRYERHVEHPDGNWTWIGRDEDGSDAVLTFGERAAFGTIPNGNQEPLRLTIANGRSWLMATDRSKIADINRAVTRSGQPDYLIPPKLVAAASSFDEVTGAANQNEAVVAAAAGNTVDVVLGYTTGFAAAYGGDSGATTRLNNLVEIGNQAYANSQINARLRIVRVVAVNYPDATDNGTALEELTGYRSGSGPITPHPAFNALRAARDQYGGDLVSVVRAFRTPENDGCGIAWLIGAEQRGIVAGDAPFGYSVVSDGIDRDEEDNRNYGCREETFAHEVGHNMGQAHNLENGSTSGVHAYSYGYRESTTTGFYTVMAYRLADSSQAAIRHFANPAVLFNGRPTGVANVSDNARSLAQTIPVIASFRAAVVPPPQATARPRDDVDGDGKSDLLWYHPAMQRIAYWVMNGNAITRHGGQATGGGYRVIARGDYNGDGRVDLIWHGLQGDMQLWEGDGIGFVWRPFHPYPGDWQLIGG